MEIGKLIIEGPYGAILTKMMDEMVRKDYQLKEIESYITQMEKFLSLMSSPNIDISDLKIYLNRTMSTTSVEALHFFFREILASTAQESVNQTARPIEQPLNLQDNLYPILTL